MFSSLAQMPTWFVSHHWGEPVAHFLRSLQRHAEIRGDQVGVLKSLRRQIDEDTFVPKNHTPPAPETNMCAVTASFWVYAYAQNLHEVDLDMDREPWDAPFAKALRTCRGLLLMLDWKLHATQFKRMWCMFEVAAVVLGIVQGPKGRLLLDISATDGEPRIFTDGLTDKETHMEDLRTDDDNQLSGWGSKTRREAEFPALALRGGLTISIEEGQTTDPADKFRILNALSLTMRDGNSESADKQRSKYVEIDRRLRAYFAGIGMRLAVQQGGLSKQQLVHAASPISRPGSPRGSPRQVRGLPLLKALREGSGTDLYLDFGGCYHMTDSDISAVSKNIPPGLRSLQMNMRRCHQFKAVDTLVDNLSTVKNLRALRLDLQDCTGISKAPEMQRLVDGLTKLERLNSLALNFRGCHQLADGQEITAIFLAMREKIVDFSLVDPSGYDIAMPVQESKRIEDKEEKKQKTVFTFSAQPKSRAEKQRQQISK